MIFSMFEYNLRTKVTVKDKVIFEDDSLNTRIEDSLWENLDQRFSLDGKFRIKPYSSWILDTGLENELFEIKVTDLNTGDIYGTFRTFFPNKV